MSRCVLRLMPYVVLAASVFATGAMRFAPQPDHQVAAVFPPWWNPAHAFAAAAETGDVIIRLGATSSIVVMMAGSDLRSHSLAQRLYAAGAWLLLDAQALGICSLPREIGSRP